MIGLEILGIGTLVLLPEFIHWLVIDRPRQKKLKRQWEHNRLFWSIRDKEMDIYGKWLS